MKKLAIIAFTALGLAACGSGRKNAAENAKVAAADPDLQGSWQSQECSLGGITAAATGPNAGLRHRVEYKFEGAKATRKTVAYSSATGCEGEVVRFEEVGDFKPETDKSKWSNDGEKPIQIVWNSLKVTPVGKAGVDYANGASLCGAQGWQEGKDKEVTAHAGDATCYNQKLPRTENNIYRVDKGQSMLQFGANITSNNQEKDRPTKANGPVYKKN